MSSAVSVSSLLWRSLEGHLRSAPEKPGQVTEGVVPPAEGSPAESQSDPRDRPDNQHGPEDPNRDTSYVHAPALQIHSGASPLIQSSGGTADEFSRITT